MDNESAGNGSGITSSSHPSRSASRPSIPSPPSRQRRLEACGQATFLAWLDAEAAQQSVQALRQLIEALAGGGGLLRLVGVVLGQAGGLRHVAVDLVDHVGLLQGGAGDGGGQAADAAQRIDDLAQAGAGLAGLVDGLLGQATRSEEHTSELQ